MYKLIKTSIDNRQNAKLIIDKILSKGLSPCVQLIDNVRSFYRWKDKIEDSVEFLILIKCEARNESAIIEVLLKEHAYEVPEIVVSEFDILNPDYRDWFEENSR